MGIHTRQGSWSRTRQVPLGSKYGRLTTLDGPFMRQRSDGRNKAYFLVRCDCGKEKEVSSYYMTAGITISCGCAGGRPKSATPKPERLITPRGPRGPNHGGSGTRLFRTWKGMLSRCRTTTGRHYEWYGKKGITVCDEWKDFEPFRDWALANGYADHLTIDRIDHTKNYEPDNCQFITQGENGSKARLNDKRNKYSTITAWGETKDIRDWANDPRNGGATNNAILGRIYKGWPAEKAISEPSDPHRAKKNIHSPEGSKPVTAWGETKSYYAWMNDYRISDVAESTLRYRVRHGWTPEEAISLPAGSKRG